MSESETMQPENEAAQPKRRRWWQRDLPPGGRVILFWLLVGFFIYATLTHQTLANQYGTGRHQATWWIVAGWSVAAAVATVRYVRQRRRSGNPPEQDERAP